jgi:hypothetical protein
LPVWLPASELAWAEPVPALRVSLVEDAQPAVAVEHDAREAQEQALSAPLAAKQVSLVERWARVAPEQASSAPLAAKQA